MKAMDEQLKKLLQEQAEIEQQPLAVSDIEAYTLLFESLESEREVQAAEVPVGVTDAVIAQVALLEERKDRRRDTITLVSALCLGLLATAVSYYFVDYPLLKTGLLWIKEHLSIVAFVVIAVFLIQFADKKLIMRH